MDTQRIYRWLTWLAGILTVYSLIGFFLVPYLVGKNAVGYFREQFDANLRVEKVAFNPYVLSLNLQGVELDDPQLDPTLRIGEVFVNFQLSSLPRLAWTFDEFRLTSPEIFLSRDAEGHMNLARFQRRAPTEVETSPVAESDEESPPPELLIFKFLVQQCVVNWHDDVPVDPIDTVFGPVDISIDELNTIPQRVGQQAVVIKTETGGTLSWSGSLELAPLNSTGHASVTGSQMPILSSYLHHDIGFDLVDGSSDLELDYRIRTESDGTLSIAVENIEGALNNVIVSQFESNAMQTAEVPMAVLHLPELRLQAGSFFWPERRIAVGRLAIDDAEINLHRFSDGSLNALPKKSSRSQLANERNRTEVQPVGATGRAWDISLTELSVDRLTLELLDDMTTPTAQLDFDDVALSVTGIDNQPMTRFPTTLSVQFRHGGALTATGEVQAIPQRDVSFEFEVLGAAIEAIQPYISEIVDLKLSSGLLGVKGNIAHTVDERLSFRGDVSVGNFELDESDEGTRLGGWQLLATDGVELSVSDNKVTISEVRLVKPYGNIHIAADGSVNLGRAGKGTDDSTEEVTQDTEAKTAAASNAGNKRMDIVVGRVLLEDAAADFADESLPIPFAAKITDLSGDMTTISTASSEASTVDFEGSVDEHGFVRIAGSITPFSPSAKTDIHAIFNNVNIPKFSSYTVPFAGREIAAGSLDLDLGYKIDKGQLVGENRIVLREIELGDKVDHPGAMNLPLGLAVALLKDPDGKIDIDLPVRGNVNEPDFNYGGVVFKALGNLVIKIVASPFALLGKLVGVEADELAYIYFLDGRADLTPPEQQKIQKISEVMALRPELILEIPGAIDRVNDGLALRTSAVDSRVDALVTADDSTDEIGGFAELQRNIFRVLYLEHLNVGEATEVSPEERLNQLRATYKTVDAEGEEAFDALAFSYELRRRLIEAQPVAESNFVTLAQERAENSRMALLAIDDRLSTRVSVGKLNAVERKDGEMVGLELVLSTGSEVAPSPEPAGSRPLALDRVDPDSGSSLNFICTDNMDLDVQIVGPDTLRVTLEDSEHLLMLQPAASGAKYSGDGITFWNKGEEALLLIDDDKHQCQKAE